MRSDDIRRLNEQRRAVHAEMLKLSEAAEKENRNLSAEEQGNYDKMVEDFKDLHEREERAVSILKMEREVAQTTGTSIEKRIGDSAAPETYKEYVEQRSGVLAQDLPEYRSAFFDYMGISNLDDLDVEEKRALSKATSAAGGYLVPTGMYGQIVRYLRWIGSVAQLATEYATNDGQTINVSTNSAHGLAYWTAENAANTPSDETFGQVQLSAFKETAKVIVSEELLQDSFFDLEAFLAQELGERFGVLENTAYIRGDGTGKPLGMLASDTATNGSIPTTTAATGNATTFSYSALITAMFALPQQYRQNAQFIVSDSAARNLYLMLDSTGRPLWNINTTEAGPDTFMGRAIYADPDMPTAAANNISVLFGDFRRAYIVRRAGGIGIQRQNELHSDNGQVGFRAYQRVDGRIVLPTAVVGLKHSAT
jgi:HK97 family phage major capsid protein